MRRKFISLILILMLLPITSLFVACGKDKGYNLNNLYNDYVSIATENDNVELNNGMLIFDYSNHPKMKTIVETTYPYTEINSYNFLFKNLMAFSSEYVDNCSYNEAIKDAKIKNQVKQDLDNLKKSVRDVNNCTNILAEIIRSSYDENVLSEVCLLRYENLLLTYDSLFHNAIIFHNTISNLYFNNILNNSNPDVFVEGYSNFDASKTINLLNSRIKYQVSNLSASYVEMVLDDETIPHKIAFDDYNPTLDEYSYRTNLYNVNQTIDENIAESKVELNGNKSKLYELAVEAYNIQTTLNMDNSKFITAFNSVDYRFVKNGESATPYQEMCLNLIESYNDLISEYNAVLVKMIAILA